MLQPIRYILGAPVTALKLHDVIAQILKWSANHESRVICVANAHMLVEAYFNAEFNVVLQEADTITPDGMPLVWMLQLLGIPTQTRVAGMDILLALMTSAPEHNISVFFVGSEPIILKRMRQRLQHEYPKVQIAGMEPLPFRPLTAQEDKTLVNKINRSGAGVVLVSLGCPKQEIWMNQHKGKINAVMLGLGGVFPIYAGILRHAPAWMRTMSLEWAFRLIQEPKRLWSRYRRVIPLFILLAAKQLLLNWFVPETRNNPLIRNESS